MPIGRIKERYFYVSISRVVSLEFNFFVFMRLQKKPEEVAWLDVPMDDLLVVQVLQPQQHVTKAFPDHNHCITVTMMVMM